MIDLWILNLLKYLKEIDDTKYADKHKNIFSTLDKMRKKLSTYKESDVNYFGINYDEKIYQKIMISEKNIKNATYYPEMSMKTSKQYKLIATSSPSPTA